MHEVYKAPPRHVILKLVFELFKITISKELHSHNCKYEDDDGQNEGQITKRTNRLTHNRDEKIKCRPRFR